LGFIFAYTLVEFTLLKCKKLLLLEIISI